MLKTNGNQLEFLSTKSYLSNINSCNNIKNQSESVRKQKKPSLAIPERSSE